MASDEMEESWSEREEEEGVEENIITPLQPRPAYTPVKGPKWFPNMVIELLITFINISTKNIMYSLLC